MIRAQYERIAAAVSVYISARWTKSSTVIGYTSTQDLTILLAQQYPLCSHKVKTNRNRHKSLFTKVSMLIWEESSFYEGYLTI